MKNWFLLMFIGIISIFGGFLALANPLKASIAAEQLAGWTFLIVGVVQIVTFMRSEGLGARVWAALVGAAGVFIGVSLLANPLSGLISLTMIVALLFFCTGIAKVFVSFSLRGSDFFWPVLMSGVISVVLAVMIFANFPMSATRILGILLAIELISNGVSLIAISMKRKSETSAS